ncbi:MAG: PKD domain-containing protein [Candidatus Bipolaricaulota bacterium]|nr:PKD domain-containing protein [Candidatus Bipolaricaulota bacterium]
MKMGFCRTVSLASLLLFLALLAACALFNQAPTAVITATPLSGESPLPVTFNASDSVDPDGEIAAVLWNFGDGATSPDTITHHTFLALTETQTFTVTLRVTDDGGASDETTQTIEVHPATSDGDGTGAPVARIVVDHFIGATPLQVAFDGRSSGAGSGSITQYRWDFGDGTTELGAQATHTYKPEVTKEFTVTLFVWNSESLVDTEQVKIVAIVPVGTASGDDPIAEVTAGDPLVLYHDTGTPPQHPTLIQVSFDPRGSSADAGQTLQYFAWDFGDGTSLVETSDLVVTHVYGLVEPSRTFTVRLYVYDDQGFEGTAILNVTLEQPTD